MYLFSHIFLVFESIGPKYIILSKTKMKVGDFNMRFNVG